MSEPPEIKLVDLAEPWNPAQATERIRSIAKGVYDLAYKRHALKQLDDRSLIMGDLTFLLKNGFVYEPGVSATRPPFWKYQIQCTTPNSKNREVRAVVIPDWKRKGIKVVTVMWADEPVQGG
ncbi:DUF4258 domain-containing protein [Bradyrhizobium sp. 168]|uniref:DUF4258 domain-containing protein n=1 Tax=Bradyrhizobium sp. 168 TaxID=2782639 RepID=UPI001FFA4332|nr:DUF4258 domain-containing protein [Bradyrhizobium sp. 168]MCK1578575.1 DUF4258 domain-containing protein [Bradyrhizobium sp. 168]